MVYTPCPKTCPYCHFLSPNCEETSDVDCSASGCDCPPYMSYDGTVCIMSADCRCMVTINNTQHVIPVSEKFFLITIHKLYHTKPCMLDNLLHDYSVFVE